MKEVSELTIALDGDITKLLSKLEEIRKYIEDKLFAPINIDKSFLSDLSKTIAESAKAIVPNLQILVKEFLIGFIVAYILGKVIDPIFDKLKEELFEIFPSLSKISLPSIFEGVPSDLEKLENLKDKTQAYLDLTSKAKSIVISSGEIENSNTESGFPRDLEFIEERIDIAKSLIAEINRLIEDINSDIPKLSVATPENTIEAHGVENFFKVMELIKTTTPYKDQIIKIEEDLNKLLEEVNKNLIEHSQIIPAVDNAIVGLTNTQNTLVTNSQHLSDAVKAQSGELKNGSEIIKLTEEDLLSLDGKLAMVGDGLVAGAGAQSEFAESTKGTVDQLMNESERITNLDPNLQNLAKRNDDVAIAQEQMNQTVGDGSAAFDNASDSVEGYSDTLEKVENSGGFFEGIKQGFKDFVENVQSNSELMADFFANTLSQMSQSFSDLFFNVITGRFDDLKDLAKQAFEAILRAFLDLVSAIATRQIVISIAGAFGFGKTASAGGGPFDLASGAINTGLDIAGLIGGGGQAVSFATAGGGIATDAIAGTLGGIPITEGATVGLGLAPGGTGILASIGSALPYIGAALAAAAIIIPLVAGLFKKTPRLDIDFDSVKTEVGRRAAEVAEFLDPEFFKEQIAQISVKRGGVGLGRGGDEGIKDIIQEKIEETIDAVQAIIFKLPSDLAKQLNEALLNTPVDIETVVKGERLLEFDAKGKEIKKKFEAFINGELSAKFLFAIRDFFTGAFEALGVLPENAQAFVDEQFDAFKNAGSREERAQIGQEFLASFNAFVDAFNIVSGNVNDSIGQTIQSINSLSSKLGFDAVPSIGELTDKLGELLENAELDAETVQMYADLRNAIVQGISDIINSITGLIGKISQLNSTIVGLGGAAVNIIPFLDQAQAKLIEFYTTNVGNLSLGEQETFLDEILGIANAKLAEEQAAFQRAQAARQRAEEAQRARIQKRIDNLNKEKDKINEVFQKRIEALNEELQIAESFAQLTESIRQTLDSIVFSPESVLTGVEQVNALQSNITGLQAELAGTRDPERQIEIVGRLEEAFKTLFDTAGDAFGVNSPEFVAIFDQVTGGLENLAELTETRGRSVEEISAEIERLTAENEATLKSIDAKIEAAQERLANIGQSTADNTFRASQDLRELFEFIRSEYIRILEERFAELEEVSEFGFKTELEGLGTIAQINNEQLTVLRSISDTLTSLQGFRRGTEGIKDFGRGTLAVLHGREAVVTEDDLLQLRTGIVNRFAAGLGEGAGIVERFAGRDGGGEGAVNEMHVDINVNVNGGSGAAASIGNEIENMLVRSIRQGGRLRSAIQEAGARRMG